MNRHPAGKFGLVSEILFSFFEGINIRFIIAIGEGFSS